MRSRHAGMIVAARAAGCGARGGTGGAREATAAGFMGGAAMAGGVGAVIGSIVGGRVMAVLSNGLALEGIGSDKVQMIKGLVLLVAVGIDVYNKTQGRPSLIGFMTRRFRGDPVPDVAASPAPELAGSAASSAVTPS